jgi:hypothetical protein
MNWLISIFVAIPKKYNAKTYEKHRFLSLMSHALKAYLKIIHKRIYGKYKEKLDDMQFGFKNNLEERH